MICITLRGVSRTPSGLKRSWISNMKGRTLFNGVVLCSLLVAFCFGQDPTPLQKVKGPTSLNDDIAVIGEDAAAVYMAYLLQEKEFDPTLYLRTERAGIDAHTYFHPMFVPQEVGNAYVWSHFTEMRKLINKLGLCNLKDLSPPEIWRSDSQNHSAFAFMGQMLATYDGKSYTMSTAKQRMRDLLNNYTALHQDIFGTYNYMLPPKPHVNFTSTLNTTIKEFLINNNLGSLQTIFHIIFTAQGYGNLDEVPALYGLLLFTPKFVDKFMESVDYPSTSLVSLLDVGMDVVWPELARKANLNVKYYHRIYKIIPNKVNNTITNFTIYYIKPNGKKYKRGFDFLVLSNNIKYKVQKLFKNATDEEINAFTGATYGYGTTSVVEAVYNNSCLKREYFFHEMLDSDPSTDVFAYRDAELSLQGKSCVKEDSSNRKIVHTGTYFQSSASKPNYTAMGESLNNFLNRYDIDGDILVQKAFRIAPKFPQEAIVNGRLHDIWNMQGKYKSWYIGPQATFDCHECTMQYNQQILANFDVPTE